MVLNAVFFTAKCKAKSINMRCDCINYTFLAMKNMAKRGEIAVKK